MKRRGHGDGSIYYRENDKRRVASLILSTGKRKYLYGQTRKEVQEKLRKAQQELEQGMFVPNTTIIFEHYLEHWLEIRRSTSTIKAVTYASYSSYLRRQVIPVLGKVKLQKVTSTMIQQLYSQLIADELSPNTVPAYPYHHFQRIRRCREMAEAHRKSVSTCNATATRKT